MVEIKDIVDRDSFEAWLIDQPQEVYVWIVWRAAMRVLPFCWQWLASSDDAHEQDKTILPILWFLLTTIVERKISTAEVSTANRAARQVVIKDKFFNNIRVSSDDDIAIISADNAIQIVGDVALTIISGQVPHTKQIAATHAADSSSYSSDWALTDRVGKEIWNSYRADCEAITSVGDLERLSLWVEGVNPIADDWAQLKAQLLTASPSLSEETARGVAAVDWSFWVKWYDDELAGNPPNWKMLERIALIDPAEWDKGAERVNNELIPEILKDFPTMDEPVADDRSVATNTIETIRQSIARNRAVVPAQLQGLIAIITAEMERLRSINVMDDIEAKNRDRQLAIFQNLADGIEALEVAVPLNRPPTAEDAEKIDGLLTVYANEFRKWPRDNANDMVDSTVRVALVGMTAGLAVTFGAPILAGVAIGGIAFGGKKLAGAAKSLKDSVNGGS